MAPYIYKRNHEGIHIINLGKSWEKLMIAARIIAAVPNPRDILVSHLTYLLCFAYRGFLCLILLLGKIGLGVCLLIDRLKQRLCPESRSKVRNSHQG